MLEGFRFGSMRPPFSPRRARDGEMTRPSPCTTAFPSSAVSVEVVDAVRDGENEEDSWHVSESIEGVSDFEGEGGAEGAEGDEGNEGDSALLRKKALGVAVTEETPIKRGFQGDSMLGQQQGAGVGAHLRKEDAELCPGSTRKRSGEVEENRYRRGEWTAPHKRSKANAYQTYRNAVNAERADAAEFALGSEPTTHKSDYYTATSRFFLPRHHPARPTSPPPSPPPNWREVLHKIREVRTNRTAPVDEFHNFLLGLRAAPDPQFQALVATLLSVQCRDSVALVAMRQLQSMLGGAATLAAVRSADLAAVEEAVSCCNYKKTKAKYIKQVAEELHLRFKGSVPHMAKELQLLPGVGPKIAHLVASVAFGDYRSGIVVDTHVRRVAERLGWTNGRACATAEATRVHLQSWLPSEMWDETTLLLVGFGQEVCVPRRPKCRDCPLTTMCPSAFKLGSSDDLLHEQTHGKGATTIKLQDSSEENFELKETKRASGEVTTIADVEDL